jgi:signal transduction histidine kinase
VLISVRPTALTDYYGRLSPRANQVATLLGVRDHRIRARYPDVEDEALYAVPLDSPLWQPLGQAPRGRFREVSPIDRIEREWVYRQVGPWPLVMVSGYAHAEVEARVLDRLRLVGLGALSANALILLLALVLTLSMQQREAMGHYLQALREVHDRNMALFEATQDGVILLDSDRPMDCNPGALRIFGARSKEEFLALMAWSPRLAPPVQPGGTGTPIFTARQMALAREKGAHRFNYLHKRLDTGEEFPADVMLTAVKLAGETVFQAVIRDISDRVRYELDLQRANDELVRRHQEQDRFLSMLSHELKTPLSVIKMSLGANANLAANRERILRNVTAIDAIVERCLQTDRLQHGRIVAHRSLCDIGPLLDRLIAESREPARLACVLEPDLPPADTDLMLLEVILSNLLDNALKYSDPASPIRVDAARSNTGDVEGVCIDVTNTAGVAGLPDVERVFSKYYRAQGAHSKTGSGLGLHIAEGFSRLLGGRLGYRPDGNRVKFSLWIPL